MKKIITLIIITLFITTTLFAQQKLTFKVLNETNKEPVAFANITFNNNPKYGTITDIDGNFTIDTKNIHTITISFLGYEPKTIQTKKLNNNIVLLKESTNTLADVVVYADENPANAIIKKVIENKDLNNPEKLDAFTFKSYNKIVVKPKQIDTIPFDSINEAFNHQHLFITETLAKRKFKKPGLITDSVIATRFSGLKKPYFAFLASNFQPFTFYNEYFDLINIQFLNPISNGGPRNYRYTLEETIERNKDTIYVISFKPKKGKNFEGLTGVLHINSNQYAVQNIEAAPAKKLLIDVKIQQQYKFIENKQWFPEQLNFELNFNLGSDSLKLNYSGRSYISEVNLTPKLRRRDFPFEQLSFDRDGVVRDSLYWINNRPYTLDEKELRTYKFNDSIGQEANLDRIMDFAGGLIKGRIPFKYVDLDINKLFNYNRYEGFRLGAGLYTNDDIIKNVSVGGYGGYGFKDHTWKYGFDATVKLPTTRDISFSVGYQNDLREVGVIPVETKKIYNSVGFVAKQMDHHETWKFSTEMKLLRNFYWNFQLSTAKINPTYDYNFYTGNSWISNYKNTEFAANFKYYFNEQVTTIFGEKIHVQSNAPVVNFSYSRGLANLFDGDFSYNKYNFSWEHTFRLRNLGNTSYRLEAGYIDADLPYGMLFTGEGVNIENFPVVIKNFYQTLHPYEFLSDSYVNLFLSHNFGGLLFKAGSFQPDIILHHNMGMGSLNAPYKHKGVGFATRDKLFTESGVELNNILKINYLNAYYLGIGVSGFYRYGAYALPEAKDNFTYKLTLSYSFD